MFALCEILDTIPALSLGKARRERKRERERGRERERERERVAGGRRKLNQIEKEEN